MKKRKKKKTKEKENKKTKKELAPAGPAIPTPSRLEVLHHRGILGHRRLDVFHLPGPALLRVEEEVRPVVVRPVKRPEVAKLAVAPAQLEVYTVFAMPC